MEKQSKKMVLFLTILFLGWSIVCWLKPAEEFSMTERRKLAQFPKLSMETISDGSFMENFESYTLDQFPIRDGFRSLKAWVSKGIFRKSDEHHIYVRDGHAVKMEYPLKEESLTNALKKFEAVYKTYLKNHAGKIYAAIVPDKNYFLGESNGYLTMDYKSLYETMEQGMEYAEFIEITDLLEADDYYKTDLHWRQECLQDVALRMAQTMNVDLPGKYEMKTLPKDFYGVYFGQTALNLPGEPLNYLTNDVLEQCSVYHYENGKTTPIYDLSKAEGEDLYEIFLSGPISLQTIENPAAKTEKELIVFRDSFGSSLIPLLAEGYRKVTLIDIRYIQRDFLANFVDFQDKDVLFLYSTVVLNNSETLK